MFYSIRHLTKFRYSAPVSESIMELRMQPRTEATQRCLSFQLSVLPRTRVASYRDYLGNSVHHFDVPGQHRQLTIVAEALVDVRPPADLPPDLGEGAWARLDAMINGGDYWEMLVPSQFARPSRELVEFASEIGWGSREQARARDPIEVYRTSTRRCSLRFRMFPKARKWIRRSSTRCVSGKACARITRTS